MTKQEFMRHIWRAYDTVELQDGVKRKIAHVCFSTQSVKVYIEQDVTEWVRCEFIVKHISVTGHPDDIETIEYLHDRLMRAEEKIIELKNKLHECKANDEMPILSVLKNKVCILTDLLREKNDRANRIANAIDSINAILETEKSKENDC